MPQQQIYQWDVPFGVLMSMGPLSLIFPSSSIRLFFFMQQMLVGVAILRKQEDRERGA